MSIDSPARDAQRAINDPRERAALRLLHEAGWTVGELAMTFQAGDGAIRRVLNGRELLADPRQFHIPDPGELRVMRDRAGMTQGQAGAKINVSKDIISRHERGARECDQELRGLLDVYAEAIHG